ncbi:dihydrolipoyl dehydrogenase, partial [Rhodococcoides fascians]|uniref:dihydrolipoyl dehydrogenase n=1 Tax=Rhodococcoides fascians TaxID=1828 RepID=UPI000B9C30D4
MTNSSETLVVLGGGSGGYSCAIRAAQLGWTVTLVESGKLGGTCLHEGCIPTKALLHAAEVADTVRDGRQFGVEATLDRIDMGGVHKYRNSTLDRLHAGLKGLLARHGVTVVDGHGCYLGNREIGVGNDVYKGDTLVIATGSKPRTLPGVELGNRIVTSDQALQMNHVPERAIVLGGGVIGLEFASIWASLGAQVTIIEALPRLAAAEDSWCSALVERAFKKRKIAVRTGASLASAVETDDKVVVSLDDGDELDADVLLVAVGRVPRTEGIGLETNGVELSDGFVVTDENLQTSVPGVYAAGDVVRGLQLAHRGFQQGRFIAEHVAGRKPLSVPDSGVPRVTYSRPEIASVGLTEAAAHEQFGDVNIATYDLAGNGKSLILRSSGGIKVVRAPADGPIVGV